MNAPRNAVRHDVRIHHALVHNAVPYRYILDDQQIDRDIRRLKADIAEPQNVVVIRQIDFREHCILKPWRHWCAEDPDHMAHPYEAGFETFLERTM